MSTVTSVAESATCSSPCGSAGEDAAASGPALPHELIPRTAPAARTAAARRRRSAPVVGLTADHPEVLVELDVHLGTVVEGHLHLVVALLVADLGARDPAAAGLGQGRLARVL